MSPAERRARWYKSALDDELKLIEQLPPHNIRKPGSQMFISLLRVASLVKGAGYNSNVVLSQIKYAARSQKFTAKDFDYQWSRAYSMAKARAPEIRNSAGVLIDDNESDY